jgi:hypothetical protein
MTRGVQREDPELTFRAFEAKGVWRVSQNHETFGDYETSGDAIRAACLAARNAEAHGHTARVLMPQGAVVAHNEPQLGL